MGFLRLATNPRANPRQTLTFSQAWQVYDNFLLDPRIGFANEPSGLDATWRTLTQTRGFSPHVWNDAYLAGFAAAGGYEVVTFDAGFSQYPGVRLSLLT